MTRVVACLPAGRVPLVRDELDDATSATRVLLMPVFVGDTERRRRLLVSGGLLAAVGCLIYLAMLTITFTATPVGRARAGNGPAADARAAAPEAGKPAKPAPIRPPALAHPPAAQRVADVRTRVALRRPRAAPAVPSPTPYRTATPRHGADVRPVLRAAGASRTRRAPAPQAPTRTAAVQP